MCAKNFPLEVFWRYLFFKKGSKQTKSILVIIGEEDLPDLTASVGVSGGGMSDSVPRDIEASHSVGQGSVDYIGANLVGIANELGSAAEHLGVQFFTLFLGFVDVFYMAVVGRNAVGDYVVGISEDLLNIVGYHIESWGIGDHFGSDTVYFFGLLPF